MIPCHTFDPIDILTLATTASEKSAECEDASAPEAAQEPNAVSLCRPRGQLYSREFPCRRMSRDALMR